MVSSLVPGAGDLPAMEENIFIAFGCGMKIRLLAPHDGSRRVISLPRSVQSAGKGLIASNLHVRDAIGASDHYQISVPIHLT